MKMKMKRGDKEDEKKRKEEKRMVLILAPHFYLVCYYITVNQVVYPRNWV